MYILKCIAIGYLIIGVLALLTFIFVKLEELLGRGFCTILFIITLCAFVLGAIVL